MPRIRKADLNDAPQLTRVAELTFREAFGQNKAENVDLHCQESYSEAIQAREITASSMVTILAEDGGKLIGFSQLRWEGAPPCVLAQSPGEIQRLYVVKEWHGQGVAQALMDACIEEIQRHGSDVVWLGVWERNPRAISFYRKFGFVEAGDHVFSLGRDPQRDIVMVRRVASGS